MWQTARQHQQAVMERHDLNTARTTSYTQKFLQVNKVTDLSVPLIAVLVLLKKRTREAKVPRPYYW